MVASPETSLEANMLPIQRDEVPEKTDYTRVIEKWNETLTILNKNEFIDMPWGGTVADEKGFMLLLGRTKGHPYYGCLHYVLDKGWVAIKFQHGPVLREDFDPTEYDPGNHLAGYLYESYEDAVKVTQTWINGAEN